MPGDSPANSAADPPARRLSYKFQRLRERIRAAIDAGELAGKLPGERSLARHFNVNAKTLSKALTDLAAEGVLQRNIGLGTFVRDGSAVAPPALRILLLAAFNEGGPLTAALIARGLDVHCHEPDGDLPPSLVAPFDLVLVSSKRVDNAIVRDLIVRGKSVVTVDRLPEPYSTHALMPHTARAAMRAAADLVTLGHRRLLLIPDDFDTAETAADVSRAVGDAVPDAAVHSIDAAAAVRVVRDGYTGAIVSARMAARVIEGFAVVGVSVPGDLALIAYGRLEGEPRCCGHYVTDAIVADTVVDLVAVGLPHKPLTLWLAGERVDRGTAVAMR